MKTAAIICAALVLPALLPAQQSAKLDPTDFVVLGEGLAAGMADFALRDIYQQYSFPAQVAQQMNTAFPQPLMQPPGIGSAPGFPALPVRLPATLQGSVREPFPPSLFVLNLSVPGMTLSDSLNRRPGAPLLQPQDQQQTVVNMILGFPALISGTNHPLWTQAEYAVAMNPTMVLVELGYYEVLTAAVADNPSALPSASTFGSNYSALLNKLKANGAQIIVTTIPDPFDTAFFTTLPNATAYFGTPAQTLQSIYGFAPDAYLTPTGLTAIGDQIFSSIVYGPLLPPGVTVSSATATAVHASVSALNAAITNAAQSAGAKVYDLHAFISNLKTNGITVGSHQLTASYLGGLYSLDGYYPGVVGQGAIADDVLKFLNSTYQTSFSMVNLTTLVPNDPAIRYVPTVKRRPVR